MFKSLALAAAIALSSAAAMAQTPTPVAPTTPAAPSAEHKPDPAKFAEHKAKLQAHRAKTDACIGAATDGKALMACIKADHEGMQHGMQHGMEHGMPATANAAGAAPMAPAAK